MTGKANSVHDFAEQIGKKLAAAELMGAEGDVEGSIKLMEEVSPSDGMASDEKIFQRDVILRDTLLFRGESFINKYTLHTFFP